MFCFFNDTATTEIYTLSLHDALPISTQPSPTVSQSPEWLERRALSRGTKAEAPRPAGCTAHICSLGVRAPCNSPQCFSQPPRKFLHRTLQVKLVREASQ